MSRMLLVGVRFEGKAKMRAGADGSIVIDALPIAGPVTLRLTPEGTKYAACETCGECSKIYKRRAVGLMQWAHQHRCET